MSLSINSNYYDSSKYKFSTKKPENKDKNDKKMTDKVSNENKDDDNNSKKTKSKSHIVTERDDKFVCTYSVSDEGGKVLLSKIPIKEEDDDNGGLLKSNKKNSLFSLDNPKFKNKSVIATTRAGFDYNQKLLQEKNHKEDLEDIMKLISPM